MDIHSLRLSITEEEINALATEYSPTDSSIENLRVRLIPEGIVILGEYPTMLMRMAFETLWEVRGTVSVVEAKLATIKVSGLPARMLRGVLLKTIRDMTADKPGIRVEEDSIRVDLSQYAAAHKVQLQVNLTGVKCLAGHLVIETGPPVEPRE
jgi:hypothetical protein